MDKSKLPKMMKKAWDVILPGGYRGRKRPKAKPGTMSSDSVGAHRRRTSERKRMLDELKYK